MSNKVVVVLIVSVFACWGIVGFGLPAWMGGEPGVFGDQFGAVNALFSGLAFVGMIYAIMLQSTQLKLQRKELELQREELKLQRKELSRSADAQAEQVAATRGLIRAEQETRASQEELASQEVGRQSIRDMKKGLGRFQ